MQRLVRILLIATIVLVAVLFPAPAASGAGPPAAPPAPQQLVAEQSATTQAAGIPEMTPSADSIVGRQAADAEVLPIDDREGASIFTWSLLAFSLMLVGALASGDSRLRMQTPDHPEWDRALH